MGYVNETTALPVQRDRYEEGSRAFRGRLQRQDEAQHEKFARALGWFSVGLGLTEMFAPRFLANAIGIRQNHSTLLRMMGARELAAGIGILSARKPAGWMWARVAGDAIDLGLLGAAFGDRRVDTRRLSAAVAMVAGVTALDAFCASALTRDTGGKTIWE